jgi:hypothetical protein
MPRGQPAKSEASALIHPTESLHACPLTVPSEFFFNPYSTLLHEFVEMQLSETHPIVSLHAHPDIGSCCAWDIVTAVSVNETTK